ncbi:MAG: metal-sulfur cluster assembly factor [Thermococci archaeon]|nr:metal-sulfur cluster assembly factor [Thermococci archaeon]
MITKEKVMEIIGEFVSPEHVREVKVGDDGSVDVTLSKDTPDPDRTVPLITSKLRSIEGVGTVSIRLEREPKEEGAGEITEEVVREKLKEVIDPEIGVDVVNLGLIYDIKVRPDRTVYVKMTMTTPGCPLTMWILRAVEEKVLEIPGVKDAEIELTFDPPWTPDMISPEYKKRLGIY